MSEPRITRIEPQLAVPGGEIAVDCEGVDAGYGTGTAVFIGDVSCRIVAASSTRLLVIVPNIDSDGRTHVLVETAGRRSAPVTMTVGKFLAGDMHIVANPAVDPSDDALILTRSGSRGQQLPATLFRLEADGYLDELPEPVLNPTGIAFDRDGQMYVTNRAQGEVYAVSRNGTGSTFAHGLGIATGIAFDKGGTMYVGDRSGTIYRVSDIGTAEPFAVLDPSVAAYHIAFGPDGRLFVTAPGLASHDAVYAVDQRGGVSTFFRGLGRPQGLAFGTSGDLYVAACYRGRHGVTRIAADGGSASHFLAGANVVGLCFTRSAEMVVATNDAAYSVPCEISGTLLD